MFMVPTIEAFVFRRNVRPTTLFLFLRPPCFRPRPPDSFLRSSIVITPLRLAEPAVILTSHFHRIGATVPGWLPFLAPVSGLDYHRPRKCRRLSSSRIIASRNPGCYVSAVLKFGSTLVGSRNDTRPGNRLGEFNRVDGRRTLLGDTSRRAGSTGRKIYEGIG